MTREYCKKDIDVLIGLWVKTFGDGEKFVKKFFELLPRMGTCVVIENDGKIVAMASVLTGLELYNDGHSSKMGYIYAVAVDENYRGLGYGMDISRAAYDKAIELGACIVTTMPASDSLYRFYGDVLGMKTALKRKKTTTPAKNKESVKKTDASAYNRKREELLENKAHLKMSEPAARLFELICTSYGGGLYETESGICGAQMENGECIIYDLISSDPKGCAASTAAAIGAKTVSYYLSGCAGEKFIMADRQAKIPEDIIFNIAFE